MAQGTHGLCPPMYSGFRRETPHTLVTLSVSTQTLRVMTTIWGSVRGVPVSMMYSKTPHDQMSDAVPSYSSHVSTFTNVGHIMKSALN